LKYFIFHYTSTSLPAARFKSSIIVLANLNLSFASFKIPSILALSSLFFLTDAKNWLKDKWTPILKAYNKAKEVKI